MLFGALIAAHGSLALAAREAPAATVSASGGVMTYLAAVGEDNNTSVRCTEGDQNPVPSLCEITEPVGVTAGPGCQTDTATHVYCDDISSVVVELEGSPADDTDDIWTFLRSFASPTHPAGVPGRVPATIDGGRGINVLNGDDGADTLRATGSVAANTFNGSGGNDLLGGGAGTGPDLLNGGSGGDTADYSSAGDPVDVSLDGAANDGRAGEGDRVGLDVENIVGAPVGGDDLTGDVGNNQISTGSGQDTADGAAGVDTASYAERAAAVSVDLADSGDDGEGGENDTLSGFENVIGGDGPDDLTGDGGPNSLEGNPGADQVSGGEGEDSLGGGTGDDELAGHGAADVLNGGPDADELSGGGGADSSSYLGRTGAMSVDLDGAAGDDGEAGEGDTTMADVENLVGGSGADVLTGNGSDNILDGGLGGDQLNGLGGSDTVIYDGSLTSKVLYSGGLVLLTQGTGGRLNPVFVDLEGDADDGEVGEGDTVATDIENIVGGYRADSLTGDGDDNRIDGSFLGDVITGNGGTDTVDYSSRVGVADFSKRVTVNLNGSADDGESGEGDFVKDDIENVIGTQVVNAGTNFTGDGEPNHFVGGDFDIASGGGGDDHLDGAAGAFDQLTGGPGEDTLDGSPGGSDQLNGGTEDDVLHGNAGGNDLLDGGAGTDILDGGPGPVDRVLYADRTASVTVDMDGNPDDGEVGEGDTVTNMEAIEGGAGNDDLRTDPAQVPIGNSTFDTYVFGNDGIDTITGGPGMDQLYGGSAGDMITGHGGDDFMYANNSGPPSGADTLIGGDGNDNMNGDPVGDTLTGGDGDDQIAGNVDQDTLSGGDGTDFINYAFYTVGVEVDLDAVADDGSPGQTENVADFESIGGGTGDDHLVGDDGPNQIFGSSGVDTIEGGLGSDDLRADTSEVGPGDTVVFANGPGVNVDLAASTATGQGTDAVEQFENAIGSPNADTLVGTAADNLLNGGGGPDSLTGAGGVDQLLLGAGLDVLAAQDGVADAVDCTGGGPDSGTVDTSPAETYTACDPDGDMLVDFLDGCPTQSGSENGCPLAPPPPPPAAQPGGSASPPVAPKRCKKGQKLKKGKCVKKKRKKG